MPRTIGRLQLLIIEVKFGSKFAHVFMIAIYVQIPWKIFRENFQLHDKGPVIIYGWGGGRRENDGVTKKLGMTGVG